MDARLQRVCVVPAKLQNKVRTCPPYNSAMETIWKGETLNFLKVKVILALRNPGMVVVASFSSHNNSAFALSASVPWDFPLMTFILL